jgi:plastocyanin
MQLHALTRRALGMAMASLLATAACGGGSPTAPSGSGSGSGGGTGGTANDTATITITAAGVSPSSVTIRQGGRVTFTNSDTRPHDMDSDPHPEHTDCPALNDVGFLSAGQSRTSGNLTTVRTCGFHDHNQPSTTSLQGRITIVQ